MEHLVEVHGGEKSVTPAKGGVGVDDQVLGFVGLADDVLEDATAEGVEALLGQVENAGTDDVGGFGVHQVADVEEGDVPAVGFGDFDDFLEKWFFLDADLSADNDADAVVGLVGEEAGLRGPLAQRELAFGVRRESGRKLLLQGDGVNRREGQMVRDWFGLSAGQRAEGGLDFCRCGFTGNKNQCLIRDSN